MNQAPQVQACRELENLTNNMKGLLPSCTSEITEVAVRNYIRRTREIQSNHPDYVARSTSSVIADGSGASQPTLNSQVSFRFSRLQEILFNAPIHAPFSQEGCELPSRPRGIAEGSGRQGVGVALARTGRVDEFEAKLKMCRC